MISNVRTALTPFHSDSNGNFHSSNSVRDITNFGYTYPELQGDQNAIRTAVNQLYGPNARRSVRKRATNKFFDKWGFHHGPPNERSKKRDLDGILPLPTNVTSHPLPPAIGSYGPFTRDYEWLANIRAHKNMCNSTLFVHVFMGNHSENPADWFNEPNSVGIHTIFARNTPTDLEVTGTLPLTSALEDKIESGELKSLCASDVKEYLKKSLDWRVSKGDGTALPYDHYPHLKISIVSSEVKPPASDYDFPEWVGDFTVHDDLTSGKAGGYSLSDLL